MGGLPLVTKLQQLAARAQSLMEDVHNEATDLFAVSHSLTHSLSLSVCPSLSLTHTHTTSHTTHIHSLTHRHARTNTHTPTHACTHTHMNIQTCVYMHMHTHTHSASTLQVVLSTRTECEGRRSGGAAFRREGDPQVAQHRAGQTGGGQLGPQTGLLLHRTRQDGVSGLRQICSFTERSKMG